MPTSINYRFTQRFKVPAVAAYRWCTSYEPSDLELMHEEGNREIEQLSKDAFILKDTYHRGSKSISKTKLVRLHPRELFWTNTHIDGPNRYSQFLYKIVPEGRSVSRLEFTGLQLEPEEMTRNEASAFARRVRKEDSASWKHLAKAMEKELLGV